jgi:hypothetical protein
MPRMEQRASILNSRRHALTAGLASFLQALVHRLQARVMMRQLAASTGLPNRKALYLQVAQTNRNMMMMAR